MKTGDRVRFVREVWRYPHFKVMPGATGVVVGADANRVTVLVDTPIAGCEEWENVVWWDVSCDDRGEASSDLEVIPRTGL